MNATRYLACLISFCLLAACGGEQADAPGDAAEPASPGVGETVEIVPGLSRTKLREGSGDIARAGDIAVVHYTGWLYDAEAPDNRGQKFDSSVDRGQHFRFPLGAGRVIDGWDQGVAGMQVGEVSELLIAPEMGYGERGAGNVIPPGATLLFEVELAAVEGRGEEDAGEEDTGDE